MPCLVLTGHPCVGKTHVAQLLRDRALLLFSDELQFVHIVNEESVCMMDSTSKSDCYQDAHHEKATRGALKARVDALLTSEKTLVIVDSLNYIKGFRYELFTLSKAQHDRHAVVWIQNSSSISKEWNTNRGENERYSGTQMDELILRYEPPDVRNRWDRPLYRIDLSPSSSSGNSGQEEVLQRSVYNMHGIQQAMEHTTTHEAHKKKPTTAAASSSFRRPTIKSAGSTFRRAKPTTTSTTVTTTADAVDDKTPPTTTNTIPATVSTPDATTDATLTTTSNNHNNNHNNNQQQQSLQDRIDQLLHSFLHDVQPLKEGISTQQAETADADTLHQLDRCTLQICQAVVVAQQQQPCGDSLVLSLGSTTTRMKRPTRTVSAMELKRLRQQYLQWAGQHPPDDVSEKGLAASFVEYLEEQIQ